MTCAPNLAKKKDVSSMLQTRSKILLSSVKVKSKAVPLHAMEAHWGRGGIAPTHS
jgi:hypothetical protein